MHKKDRAAQLQIMYEQLPRFNTVRGSNYAYGRPITQKNLHTLGEKVTDGVCENARLDGELYTKNTSQTNRKAHLEEYSEVGFMLLALS